jgi:predicted nucleic acid-binding protein
VTVYFDSSALVKLLLREDGWELVRELWRRAALRAVNRLAYPEVRAGLAAAVRAGRISAAALDELIGGLHEIHVASFVVDIDWPLSVEAGDLADGYALRGYDGVHLAAALNIDSPRVVVATWDRELAAAASACGCAVAPAPA